MKQQTIDRLIRALEPFADLMEEPLEWPGDYLVQLFVSIYEIAEAKAALREARIREGDPSA